MASASLTENASTRKITDLLSCRQILNFMVILGFMFNYMLRVNISMAIVAMVNSTKDSSCNHTELHIVTPSQNLSAIHIQTIPINPNNVINHPEVVGTIFDWDKYSQNIILGSFFWGYLLTEVPGGRLAELFGARRVFGGGMLAASILTLLTPLACHLNYMVVAVLRALIGFFLGATWPAMPPMAAKWIPPLERSKFIANMMASSLGAALTMPVCGFLISHFGWESVFYVTGGVGLVWSIIWFFVVYDSPAQHPRISMAERQEIEGKIAEGAGTTTKKPSHVPWKAILTSPPVWAIVITHTCSVFGFFTVCNELPTYMKEVLCFNIDKNGLLSSLPYLAKYIMAVIASYFADRLLRAGKLTTTVIRKGFTAFAVLIPGFLMVIQALFGEDPAISVTIFTGALFFNGAVTAGYLSNSLDIAPNFSGTIFGIANTLSSAGGGLTTMMVAAITEEDHSFAQWRYVFWVLAVIYAIGGTTFLAFGTGERQPWNSVERRPSENGHKVQELQPLKNYKENEVRA